MISVILRSKNDVALIRQTVEGLLGQRDCDEFEIISCDDSSTDGTAEIIAEYPEVRRIDPESVPYNPARVLNRAVQHTKGELIIFNNSDSIPQNDQYFRYLIEPLADPQCGAVYGCQLPRPDAWAFIKREHQRVFNPQSSTSAVPDFFSLVASATRREILLEEPFDLAMQYSEDIEWSRRIQKKMNLQVVYAPKAVVEHSHNYTFREVWKRFFNEGRAEVQISQKPPAITALIRQPVMEILRDLGFELKNLELNDIPRGILYRIIQKYATFRGGYAEAGRWRL